jgi:hypothetical protein
VTEHALPDLSLQDKKQLGKHYTAPELARLAEPSDTCPSQRTGRTAAQCLQETTVLMNLVMLWGIELPSELMAQLLRMDSHVGRHPYFQERPHGGALK